MPPLSEAAVAMKLAGGIETVVGTGRPRRQEFAINAYAAAKSGPNAIEDLLLVESKRGMTPPAQQMEKLSTRLNFIGEGPIDSVTGVKDRTTDPDAKARFDTGKNGSTLVESLRAYEAIPDGDQKKLDLQDRVIKRIQSRPEGKQIITGATEAERRTQADLFIKNNYKSVVAFAEQGVEKCSTDPSLDPTASAEQVLIANNRHNDVEFIQKEATEALDQGDKELTRLLGRQTEYAAGPTHDKNPDMNPDAKGTNLSGRMDILERGEIVRNGEMSVLANRIKDNQQQLDSINKQLKDLEAKKFGGFNKPELEKKRADIKILLEQNTLAYTDRLSAQQKLEDMRKEKQELPDNIKKAKTEKNRLTAEKLKADSALARSSEDLYYAKRTRVATERALSESVDNIVDFAVDETINKEISRVAPLMKEGVSVEMQERLAELDQRLLQRFKKKSRIYLINKEIVWNKDEINDLYNMLRDKDDALLDAYISGKNSLTVPKGNKYKELVDNWGTLKKDEKNQVRAVLANRIIHYERAVVDYSPSKGDLLKFQAKGWLDPLIDMGIANNKTFVEQATQLFPGEEITTDNQVLKSRLKAAFLNNSGLFLTLLTMSAAMFTEETK